jgi:translation initiation factor 2 subunit 1
LILRKKVGFPEEGDLVWCVVTKIHFHSVFCNLEEYGKSGMIHISEVSPGRIRNIRDYVKEGKTLICKVLTIDEKKGHIDLSLRRVTEGQKRNKSNQIKQEQKAEKILESAAKRLKQPVDKLAREIQPIKKEYDLFFSAFEDVIDSGIKLESLGVDKTIAKELEAVIKEKIKPKTVTIKGKISVHSYESDGLKIISDFLTEAAKQSDSVITYAGSGTYRVIVESKDYKDAEERIKKLVDLVEKFKEGEAVFSREK